VAFGNAHRARGSVNEAHTDGKMKNDDGKNGEIVKQLEAAIIMMNIEFIL
jgi:hypothetical protein